jgi:hypothetical protein
MSWQYDREPIDYLRRRVRYYQRRRSKIINLPKNPEMIKKLGDELPALVVRRVWEIDSYIDMFKKAVKDLEAIEEKEEKELRLKELENERTEI